MANPSFNTQALKTEIRNALVNNKAFAGPIAMRVAWHSAGTFDKSDGSGGTDGATMRFEPEKSDDANNGLHIVRHMLHEVYEKYPQVSQADIWAYAGCVAIEFMGGPEIPFNFGRKDDDDGARCPANGRLPDAAQGAQHLRDVFYRQGFNDQEIVALSGGHTVGRAHQVRSGFDGPWTHNPLTFDNSYFTLLLNTEWTPRKWDGNLQYTDPTDTLMMLPTDVALLSDDGFRPHVERYAADQQVFFDEFAAAYGKLMANGCPAHVQPNAEAGSCPHAEKLNHEFREYAMHGSVHALKKIADQADVHEAEKSSGRNALHKAAFWGHKEATQYLIGLGLDLNAQDNDGDTALHDAVRYGHLEVSEMLLNAGADAQITNNAGEAVSAIASRYGHGDIARAIAAKV